MQDYSTVVLFKDKEGNVDFGLQLPGGEAVVCFCCGSILALEDIEILYDFNHVECLEEIVASGGFYDELPDELKPLYTGAK